MKKIIFFILFFSAVILPQQITWNEITSNYNLPQGVKIFEGTRQSPALKAYYIDADLNNPAIAVRPYVSGTNMNVKDFTAKVGAYAAVNGGFFGGTTPYSAVVYPNEVKAVNVQTVTRNSQAYPVIRSFFGMKTDRSLSVNWIYQFGNGIKDIYTFDQPLQYANNAASPLPVPSMSSGTQYKDLLTGIGGGPTLVKNGKVDVTYDEEIMWGSGVGETNTDPRTAVGYTSNKHVIILVADGRQSASLGVSLPDLAQIMIDLGCVEAMNLDGGGSTQMAADGKYVDSPSEQRELPAILAVVSSDSLNIPKEPVFQKILDTGDTSASVEGGGWFNSANPGYWGNTPSMLHPLGQGNSFVKFKLDLPADALYDVYAWWVASSNRCSDTPYIIHHKNGVDTVRVDQTSGGSAWQYLGSYEFSGDSSESVVISDAGTTGSYVVADAVKLTSFDPSTVTSVKSDANEVAVKNFELNQNYPNPFNPSTVISYQLPSRVKVQLKVYDVLGHEVATLVNGLQAAGIHHIVFNAQNQSGKRLSSGIYFYKISAGSSRSVRKMLLLK